MARSTDYSPELAKEICDTIASSSIGIKKLCKSNSRWPNHDTIYQWLANYKEFSDLYAQAKRYQVELLVDEILEIADDSTRDDLVSEDGQIRCNNEWIARSRLRIDTRKWLACKLVPRVYGKGADEDKSSVATLVDKLIDRLVD